MKDNITVEKIWQDNELIELSVVCSSKVVIVSTKIYVSSFLINKLILKIDQFLQTKCEECVWECGERGDHSTASLSFKFLRRDSLGHILIEVFVEVDDGGSYADHHCCFFIETELGLLTMFRNQLKRIPESDLYYEIQLNNA